jgi:catechol 2,3-dioxygenase-like lactoylglutathione lyase family enzyme
MCAAEDPDMTDDLPSALSHVSLGTNDFDRAVAFYDRVLAPLGMRRIEQFPGGVGWGRRFPEFWVQTPIDGRPATTGNGTHVAFLARDRSQVQAFHAAGLAAGATCDGPPGERPQYGEPYYAAFLRDPDGHKVEAMCWEAPLPA